MMGLMISINVKNFQNSLTVQRRKHYYVNKHPIYGEADVTALYGGAVMNRVRAI
jgi:hypothetical protein